MLILRIIVLFVGAHSYIFLSGLVYHYLEHPEKASIDNNVEKIVEKFLTNRNRPKVSKVEIVEQLRGAFNEDNRIQVTKEFSSLWKSYLFSLTSITTVGMLFGLNIYLTVIFSHGLDLSSCYQSKPRHLPMNKHGICFCSELFISFRCKPVF